MRHAILDAECVCDGDNGIADFERLMARVHDASAYAYAFDLLALDGEDTRKLPLSERKAALGKLLRKAKPGIRYSEHLSGDGRIVFDQACQLGPRRHCVEAAQLILSQRQGENLAEDEKPEVHCTSVSQDKLPHFGLQADAPLATLTKRLVCSECGSKSVQAFRYIDDAPPTAPRR